VEGEDPKEGNARQRGGGGGKRKNREKHARGEEKKKGVVRWKAARWGEKKGLEQWACPMPRRLPGALAPFWKADREKKKRGVRA